jgi:hypothetical protein
MHSNVYAELFKKFANNRPMATLGLISVRTIFSDSAIDDIFNETADTQYTKEIAFSLVANLLGSVALYGAPSINSAYQKVSPMVPVSLSALYQKLRNTEPKVCEVLVRRPAQRADQLIRQLKAVREEPIDGYRLRIIDGNYLARTQRRILELRNSTVSSLPGMSIAVYDYATDLITDLRVDENGHTNERKLTPSLYDVVNENDLFVADSLYCTYPNIDMFVELGAKYLIRHHSSIPLEYAGTKVACGRCKTGKVFYQTVEMKDGRKATAIIIHRDRPGKDGKKVIVLLTNLKVTKKLAVKLANLYLKRWKIEEAFRQLTEYLSCEVKTLGYPRAALLAFSLAVSAYNCLRCIKAAVAANFGVEEVDENLSMYCVGLELKQATDGMLVVLDAEFWNQFETMSIPAIAKQMKRIASLVDFNRYRKSPRSPKKKKPPLKRQKHVHTATADILAKRQTRKSQVK